MLKIEPGKEYIVTAVLESSSFYEMRSKIVGNTVRAYPVKKVRTRRLLPRNARIGRVHFLTGPLRGTELELLGFTAHRKRPDVCECSAYPFPHALNGGKCKVTGVHYEPPVYCGYCGLRCNPRLQDEGLGLIDAFGISRVDHDYVVVSDCCGEGVYKDGAHTVPLTLGEIHDY